MSKTWYTFAEKLRSCPHSATRTSSPSMKVQHKKKKIVLCVRADSEPHEEWNVIPGERLFSISLCLRFRVWSRKSLCWRPMLGYISLGHPVIPSQHGRRMCWALCLLVPLTPDEIAINQNPPQCMFLCNAVIMGPCVSQLLATRLGCIESQKTFIYLFIFSNIKSCFIEWIWNWVRGSWLFFSLNFYFQYSKIRTKLWLWWSTPAEGTCTTISVTRGTSLNGRPGTSSGKLCQLCTTAIR